MKLNATLRAMAAGLCGQVAHSSLMFLKARLAILPSFNPYETLQSVFAQLIGADAHPFAAWALSFVSAATVIGLLLGHVYQRLPGTTAISKGLLFGLLGWAAMNVLFFPAIGLGLFAVQVGLGVAPALFSLAMLLTHATVMGVAYATFTSER